MHLSCIWLHWAEHSRAAGDLPLLSAVADGIHGAQEIVGPIIVNNTIISSTPQALHAAILLAPPVCFHHGLNRSCCRWR